MSELDDWKAAAATHLETIVVLSDRMKELKAELKQANRYKEDADRSLGLLAITLEQVNQDKASNDRDYLKQSILLSELEVSVEVYRRKNARIMGELDKATDRVSQLEAVLAFYARQFNYQNERSTDGSPIYRDWGAKAREVLKATQDPNHV